MTKKQRQARKEKQRRRDEQRAIEEQSKKEGQIEHHHRRLGKTSITATEEDFRGSLFSLVRKEQEKRERLRLIECDPPVTRWIGGIPAMEYGEAMRKGPLDDKRVPNKEGLDAIERIRNGSSSEEDLTLAMRMIGPVMIKREFITMMAGPGKFKEDDSIY